MQSAVLTLEPITNIHRLESMFSESTQKRTCFELDEKTRFVVPIKLPLKQAKSKQLTRKENNTRENHTIIT